MTNQDVSYPAAHLLDYRVVWITRRTSAHAGGCIQHLGDRVKVCGFDQTSLPSIVDQVQLDEVYNLAVQSFITTSWQQRMPPTVVNASSRASSTGAGNGRLRHLLFVSSGLSHFRRKMVP
jgi:GDPmannose 4,6-dehydratase